MSVIDEIAMVFGYLWLICGAIVILFIVIGALRDRLAVHEHEHEASRNAHYARIDDYRRPRAPTRLQDRRRR